MSGMKMFMQVDGIPGSAVEAGRENWSLLTDFDQELDYPFDARENRGAGEPRHGAVTAWKDTDKSSPKLAEALAKKRRIESVTFEFERDNPRDGAAEVYYRVLLEDCRVVQLRPSGHVESVGFSYRKITWTFDSGGAVEATFDFRDPTA